MVNVSNDQIWLVDARWMIFSNIRTEPVRKLILNGGAIWPRALLLLIAITWHSIITKHIHMISDLYDDIDYKCQRDIHAMVDWRILSLHWSPYRIRKVHSNIIITSLATHCADVSLPGGVFPKWRPSPWKYAHVRVLNFNFCSFWPPKPVTPSWALLRGLPV